MGRGSFLAVGSTAFFLSVPIFILFLSWATFDWEVWKHLHDTSFYRSGFNTFSLITSVTLGATLLGGLLAWWSATLALPRWADIILVLPLTLPKYVLGFIYLSFMDYAGDGATALREWTGFSGLYFETGTLAPVAFVMIFALYPYVFLLVREGLSRIDGDLVDAARVSGAKELDLAFGVAFPVVRPWVISGALIVCLETLADFGTVSVFNYDTLTTLVYRSWFGLFSFATAGQLSSLVVVIALGFYLLQSRATRKRERFKCQQSGRFFGPSRQDRSIVPVFFAVVISTLGFFFPLVLMILEAMTAESFPAQMIPAAEKTVVIALVGAFLVVGLGLFISFLMRHREGRVSGLVTGAMRLGYGIPGVVLAVGVLLVLAALDRVFDAVFSANVLVLSGTFLATQFGLLCRFFVLGFDTFLNRFVQIPRNLEEMAQLVGAGSFEIVRSIYRPLLTRTAFAAFILAFVEIAKEMPITLMTRQFGYDTLAIKVFEYTSEGQYEYAVFPSIFIAAISFLPVVLLGGRGAKRPEQLTPC